MSVLVCFHAHPDDEVFLTGGVMRQAADAGHRVVVVTATDGALGQVPDGLLTDDETLAQRRRRELEASTSALGAHRLVMLHYADSGMAGTADNENPDAFCNIDVETAAARLAEILAEESADVLTIYDPNGGYGHPDHIQVHRVGVRAAELANVPHVYEATINRDHIRGLTQSNPEWAATDFDTFGLPDSEVTTVVDVSTVLAAKRAAMFAYETQIGDFGPFLHMPGEQLQAAFGREWFRRHGAPAGATETALPLEGVSASDRGGSADRAVEHGQGVLEEVVADH
ncbi:GlcNAc-PI de-N-acetylase [Rhodococcus spongiicola]|uniref:GlcNAc-PI de-N-acetylase n=1 Tax=Rhodococcus spongiicola TaxID=2487352 RepID=A0A3S3DYD5_9NOCA|nr:GlcNAc-PI de-N-acetylase [Rhodococcus spongiicola]